jgi:heme exporter protein C
MKALIILSGLAISLVLGFFPSISKKKSKPWMFTVITLVSLTIFLSIYPPLATDFVVARAVGEINPDKITNVYGYVIPEKNIYSLQDKTWEVQMFRKDGSVMGRFAIDSNILPEEFKEHSKIVVRVKYNKETAGFVYQSTAAVNPLFTLPFIPGLEGLAKILNFHVPMSWVSVLAFLMSMVYSIMYLTKKDVKYDIYASSSAALGTLFSILATVTGMVWAKFAWGSFWNWDPRETSIFVLLLIYAAYFALRLSIEKPDVRYRLSAVYSIIAFITVPFFIFIIPRIASGLHPGSASDTNAGPIVSAEPETLNIIKQYTFSLALASFTLVYFWLLNVHIRLKKIKLFKGL